MTDNEIIKALEHHKKRKCFECPLRDNEKSCSVTISTLALDLINHQKAEIERLQTENNQFADIGKMYSEIKAEAIKEFAERLIENSWDADTRAGYVQVVDVGDIEDLVEEMAVIRND